MNRIALTDYPSAWWMVFVELWRLIGLWENHPPHIRAMFMDTPGIDTRVSDCNEKVSEQVRKNF